MSGQRVQIVELCSRRRGRDYYDAMSREMLERHVMFLSEEDDGIRLLLDPVEQAQLEEEIDDDILVIAISIRAVELGISL